MGDLLQQILIFGVDLLGFEAGELIEAKIENGIRLFIGQIEAAHQFGAGCVSIGRGTDDLDDFIEMVERFEIALENMGPGFCSGQFRNGCGGG